MRARGSWTVAPLLFASGAAGLVYQIAWQRELRLVFGGSTAASAAVIAIFIGGVGAGGYLLGARADRSARPLAFYAALEAGIAVGAALSPALLALVRALYVGAGGSFAMGAFVGTSLRLVLTALVLLGPTLLMGGTLPAAGRSVQADDDPRRRSVALLYGANTFGAVAGCVLATFVLLERLGTRKTLGAACVLNLVVALIAWLLDRRGGFASAALPARDAAPHEDAAPSVGAGRAPRGFVLGALAAVGFAFFAMELVWYRVLGPLLGGSVFTFGLILAVALAGIGIGSVGYALFGRLRPATLGGFATTCLLEAVALAAPFVLGDRMALLALWARPAEEGTFARLVVGWSAVTTAVVLPASIVAGAQFPLLIALLGRGARDVGRQIGLATALNTGGAIAGALLAGFGMLPILHAEGAWRLASGLLALLGAGAALVGWLEKGAAQETVPPSRRAAMFGARGAGAICAVLAAAAVMTGMLAATGPTVAWRHSPIGAGRVDRSVAQSPNAFRAWIRERRRHIVWQAEGIESSVALDAENGLAFLVNGKADGNSIGDAPTQVMGGLVGALLHPAPRRAMVVGLGTGSTAGWLGQVPSIEAVDVAELEPAMLEVGRACAPVNRRVLDNPKVHVILGDAREILLTSARRYDIVFSEPSNPYRAGVASLFTREYYEAIDRRLEPGGLFLQWVQGYEVDDATLRTIYATVLAVFPRVETWRLATSDLLLVASREPIGYELSALRSRIASEPFASALRAAWRVDDVESVLAHFVARPAVATALAAGAVLNTDDRNVVEFGFARTVGRRDQGMDVVEAEARERREARPELVGASVDWERVDDARLAEVTAEGSAPKTEHLTDEARLHRAKAHAAHLAGTPANALTEWRAQSKPPSGPVELAIYAEGLADVADPEALTWIDKVAASEPTEADAITGRLRLRQGKREEACAALENAFVRWRDDPWASADVMFHALSLVDDIASQDEALAARLYRALERPFSMHILDESRARTLMVVGSRLPLPKCAEPYHALDPFFPWDADLLAARRGCYDLAGDPAKVEAARDVDAFSSCGERPRLSCW